MGVGAGVVVDICGFADGRAGVVDGVVDVLGGGVGVFAGAVDVLGGDVGVIAGAADVLGDGVGVLEGGADVLVGGLGVAPTEGEVEKGGGRVDVGGRVLIGLCNSGQIHSVMLPSAQYWRFSSAHGMILEIQLDSCTQEQIGVQAANARQGCHALRSSSREHSLECQIWSAHKPPENDPTMSSHQASASCQRL